MAEPTRPIIGPLRQEPRDYQVEAAKWAYEAGRGVVCMPTGVGKTLVAVLWLRWLFEEGRARRALVLEPTRFLVEQIAKYMREVGGLDARPVHGSLSRGMREWGWRGYVVVATPEIVVAEWDKLIEGGFDALVVDECHHTTGQDAYVKVVTGWDFKWRLGLSAFIPPSRRRLIEETIGPIRYWSWSDPRLAKYIPPWEAEVYESPLNEVERKLYEELEELAEKLHGRDRAIVEMAARWLVRDGALAIRETVSKRTRMAEILEPLKPLIFHPRVRPAHKLDALKRVLRDHEGFEKAIVFVERVVVARFIADSLAELNPVLILGRRHGGSPREVLEKARSSDVKLIVSTSAGEEGIDLPEADLLVVWSHTTNPTRLVQRIGRVLRATGERARMRWVVYLATPDTVDVDTLIDALIEAQRVGVNINIDPGVIEYLWSLSRRRRILELLEQKPMDVELLSQAARAPRRKVEAALKWLTARGLVVYIYTHLGRTYCARTAITKLYEEYGEYLKPSSELEATITLYPESGGRVTLRGHYHSVALRARSVLEEVGSLSRVSAAAQVFIKEMGLIKLVRLTYAFKVDSWEVLKLVLDNVYSAERFAAYT